MQDTKLFETILAITAPWHIARVELKADEKRVDLWLEHDPTRWRCPECGAELAGFDHAEERTWRHLDTVATFVGPTTSPQNPPMNATAAVSVLVSVRFAILRASLHVRAAVILARVNDFSNLRVAAFRCSNPWSP